VIPLVTKTVTPKHGEHASNPKSQIRIRDNPQSKDVRAVQVNNTLILLSSTVTTCRRETRLDRVKVSGYSAEAFRARESLKELKSMLTTSRRSKTRCSDIMSDSRLSIAKTAADHKLELLPAQFCALNACLAIRITSNLCDLV
jgi:hypothetical protein